MVIVYRTAPLTWFLGRRLVRGVQRVGMPNIIAGHDVVPELLQGAATGATIAAAAREILETPGRRETMVTELAAHFERGGDIARALRYLAEAARQALQRAANLEAIGHLQRALQLLASLAPSVERDRQELGLQAMLAMPLLMTQGHTAPAVSQAFSRAFELTDRAGTAPELFSSLFGLFRHALVGGDLARAQRLAEQMLQAAEQEPGRPRLLEHGCRA